MAYSQKSNYAVFSVQALQKDFAGGIQSDYVSLFTGGESSHLPGLVSALVCFLRILCFK